MKYNLLNSPWIHVIYKDSRTAWLSIFELMNEIRSVNLAYCNPMDKIAVFRFLLALSYWCYNNTGLEIEDRTIPQKWIVFLKEKTELFNLLGEADRFLQQDDLRRTRTITELFHEFPKGNNFWHFNHIREYAAGICTRCLVPGILRLNLFFLGGTPDLKSGINGVPPIYAIFLGDSIVDAILRNWDPIEPLGHPVWEEAYNYNDDEFVPLVAGMTVPARRLHVGDPIESDLPCIICGSKENKLHFACKFEAAQSLNNQKWIEPFAIYRDDKTIKTSDITKSSSLSNDFKVWELLYYFKQKRELRAGDRILLVGLATDNAKFADLWEQTIVIPTENFIEDNIDTLSSLRDSVNRMKTFTYVPKDVDYKRYKKTKDNIRNIFLPSNTAIINNQIEDMLTEQFVLDHVAIHYIETAKAGARLLIRGQGVQQFKHREMIANSLPEFKFEKVEEEGGDDDQSK